MKKVTQLSAVLGIGIASWLGNPWFITDTLISLLPDEAYPSKFELMAQAQPLSAPAVPPLPTALPEAISPTVGGIVGLYPEVSEDIGIGHLRPKDLSFLEEPDWPENENIGAGWLQAIAVPIYAAPGENHWGWLIDGWLVPNGQEPLAVGRDAAFLMLHTYYAMFSFPVTEVREDGWFQLKYTPAGTAWVHASHLNLGDIELTVERWEDRFLELGWIEFRNYGISQSLRAIPSDGEPILGLVGAESYIEPLAFDGNWMRVRVTQPVDGCEPLSGARTQEGWMRWRNSENQSLVWYPPKGC
ncbi:MAG: hypothetical protein AAGG53_16255 [Cyanobacteria bacterium P01_H01_bin.152]